MGRFLPVSKVLAFVGVLLVVVVGAAGLVALEDDSAQFGQASVPTSAVGDDSGPTSTVAFKPGLEADIYRPDRKGSRPAVLLVHGGGLWTGSRTDYPLTRLAERLRARGILAVSIDYTLNAGFEAPSVDVRDALTWLRGLRGVDPDRIGMLGQSAGVNLVAFNALQDPVRVLVLSSPGGGAGIVSTYGSPDDPETLVLRGADDSLAPIDGVNALVDALEATGVAHEYRIVEGAGHPDVVIEDMPKLLAWLSARLQDGR